jgi:hypothetical protein
MQQRTLETLLYKINEQILNPLIVLMFALALVLFIWGATRFIWKNDSDEERRTGAQHMLWGVVGMFIMVSVKAILWIVANTFGLDTRFLP